MKILQLCFFTNLWPSDQKVLSIDTKFGLNVLNLSNNFGRQFDLILSAPPCDQFTKANSLNWSLSPDYFISVAKKCFDISTASGKPWLLENPPGRIESFLPGLRQYRITTWSGTRSNKEYVVYSNYLLIYARSSRYGKPGSNSNFSKRQREKWTPEFYEFVIKSFL